MTYAGWPDLYVEIAPGFSPLDANPTWRDVSAQSTWDITTKRGRSAGSPTANAGTGSFVFDDAEDRAFDPLNTDSPWHATYLTVNGVTLSCAHTPDSVALSPTGDFSIYVLVKASDWTTGTSRVLASKYVQTAGNQRSWLFLLDTGDALRLRTSSSGSADATNTASTADPTLTDGKWYWLGADIDVSNAGNKVVSFWQSEASDTAVFPWEAATFTAVGTPVTTAGTTTIFNSTARVELGNNDDGTGAGFVGDIARARYTNGLAGAGTVLADPDFTIAWAEVAATPGTVSDSVGNVWTTSFPAARTPDLTIGSYIRPRMPVRFRAEYESNDYPLWRGHLSLAEQTYPPNGKRQAKLSCTDLFGVLASVPVSDRSAWASTVESLNPVAWWRFGDQPPADASTLNGVTATDETGRNHGFYAGDTPTSTTGLVDNDQSGALATGTNGFVVLPATAADFDGEAGYFVLWVTCPTVSGSDKMLFSLGGTNTYLQVFVTGSGGDAGKVGVVVNGGSILLSTSTIDDGSPHMVSLRVPQSVGGAVGAAVLHIDGTTEDTQFASGLEDPQAQGLWVGVKGDGTALAQGCVVDEFLILHGSTSMATLYEAGSDSWGGETTGERVARAATLALIPDSLLDLDDGISTVAGWTAAGSALDVAQAATVTEAGSLVVSAAGVLTFRDRHATLNLAVSIEFNDKQSDLAQVYYAEHDSEYGEARIVNRALFTSPAGSSVAVNADSIDRYGIHGVQVTTIDDNPDNLANGAQYMVARNADPQLRTISFTVDPTFDDDNGWDAVLGLDIGDRVKVRRVFNVGSDLNHDLVIVGVNHTLKLDRWRTTFLVTTADTSDYFTLDDADLGLLDGEAVLAF